MADRAFLEKLSRDLVDKGELIEAGWISLRLTAIPLDAGPTQLDEMRNAFFAGAQHLFASIMTVMDPDAEPAAKDMERMDNIDKELRNFIQQYELRHNIAKGRA